MPPLPWEAEMEAAQTKREAAVMKYLMAISLRPSLFFLSASASPCNLQKDTIELLKLLFFFFSS